MEAVPTIHAPPAPRSAQTKVGTLCHAGVLAAAFVYLMNGDRRYADFAWEVFQLSARTNRWGWFPWNGSHMPQIHFRHDQPQNCLIVDCVWDTLTPQQRQEAREIVAAKVR